MPPDTSNPIVVAASAFGFLVSLPVLYVLWKAALFFAMAVTKLKQIDAIAEDVKNLSHDKADDQFSVQMSLTVIESDINALQEKAGIPVRVFPDRRTGPQDRRRT